uniref:DUF5615 domain-containing protein n=1 Tax=Candidatus Kentrum sp. FW TaxID=2126338 RepID=A0A450TXS1_9GAMM|nr:MAG: hypothetical protein BECKFW1821C_GA0114237_105720 [Candidatus Kentron sp. FW]
MSARKVLLDECVPRKLARYITGHEVSTVQRAGWVSFENGDLLRRAETHFDVLITIDRNFMYQQNLPGFEMAVIVLTRGHNKVEDLLPLIPRLLDTIPVIEYGTAIVLDTP